MSVGISRDLSQHREVTFEQSIIERAPSPFFAPPVPTGMQEPGTNYYTIVTAEGPHTTMTPGTRGGIANFKAKTDPYVPLTRKGG